MEISKCPITGSVESIDYFTLGEIPLVNKLCRTREESLMCERYDLSVKYFIRSGLSCLKFIPDNILFEDYPYRTGINKPYLVHCASMFDYLDNFISFIKPEFVIADIGGNDGSLLSEFKKKLNDRYPGLDIDMTNVDPSSSFIKDNQEKGIKYMKEYFSEKTRLEKKPHLITSTNVFQHLVDIRSFAEGIKNNLATGGVWCLEFPYVFGTLINDNYDQFYHEHVYYYLFRNIHYLLKEVGLRVINVSYWFNIHAGSLRVLATHDSPYMGASDSTIDTFLGLEKNITAEYCQNWGKRIHSKIEDFREFLYFKYHGKYIAGFAAAAKGCVFLNSIGAGPELVRYVIDDTPEKQGKFIPGTGIEIVSRDILKTEKPDYILILAHNFKDYIMESLKGIYSGKFIIMFPEIKII